MTGLMTHTTISQAQSLPTASPSPKMIVTVLPGSWSNGIIEADSKFNCTGDTILIGRSHYGDENKPTKYKCGTATQFGRPVTLSDKVTSDGMKEAYSSYTCPTNTVMTGREHDSDENGTTRYECAKATGELGPLQVAPGAWSENQAESDSSFECAANTVLIGRAHDDDENGSTRVLCATLW